MIERRFIQQSIKKMDVEHYLSKQLERAGFCGMSMAKTPVVTRITLRVTRPGLAIGKKGKNIAMLTHELEERFDIRNPQIEIQEISEGELSAAATVDKITSLLSRGYSWRSIAYRTVEELMSSGAQGVELRLKGKLAGKGGRKKNERIARGYMKKSGGYASLVEYAQSAAYPKAGAIGIKLRLIRPGVVFPDKVRMEAFIEERKEAKGEEKGEKKEGEEKEPQEEEPKKEEKPAKEKKPKEAPKKAKKPSSTDKEGKAPAQKPEKEEKKKPAKSKKQVKKEEKPVEIQATKKEKPPAKKEAPKPKEEKPPKKKPEPPKGGVGGLAAKVAALRNVLTGGGKGERKEEGK